MFWLMLQYLVFLVLAALVGLFVGWLVWGRRSQRAAVAFESRAKELRAELMALRRARADADERVTALRGQLAAAAAVGTGGRAAEAADDRDDRVPTDGPERVAPPRAEQVGPGGGDPEAGCEAG